MFGCSRPLRLPEDFSVFLLIRAAAQLIMT
jgi:hypothetical protein